MTTNNVTPWVILEGGLIQENGSDATAYDFDEFKEGSNEDIWWLVDRIASNGHLTVSHYMRETVSAALDQLEPDCDDHSAKAQELREFIDAHRATLLADEIARTSATLVEFQNQVARGDVLSEEEGWEHVEHVQGNDTP